FTITASATTMLLDFDGDQSIKQTGNGKGNGSTKYMMTPAVTFADCRRGRSPNCSSNHTRGIDGFPTTPRLLQLRSALAPYRAGKKAIATGAARPSALGGHAHTVPRPACTVRLKGLQSAPFQVDPRRTADETDPSSVARPRDRGRC